MIAIVEDDIETARILVRLLSRAGFEAVHYEGCPAFFGSLPAGKPDLLILDIMMPGMDGMQCLRQLRGQYPAADLPIVMYSAGHDRDHVAEAMRLGAQAFVVKGTDWPELMAIIHHHAIRRPAAAGADGFPKRSVHAEGN